MEKEYLGRKANSSTTKHSFGSSLLGKDDKGGRIVYVRNIAKMDMGLSHEIYSKARFGRFWRLVVGADNPLGVNPLFILLVLGLAGILLDLDHFIIKQLQMVRPLHLPYWIASGIICFSYCAYIYRRVHKIGLKE